MSVRRRAAPGPGGPPARLGRVLLLEDEQDVAELIRYNLSPPSSPSRASKRSGAWGIASVIPRP